MTTPAYSASLSYCVYSARDGCAYHTKYGGRDPATTIQRAWRRYRARRGSQPFRRAERAVAYDLSPPLDFLDAKPEHRFMLMMAERIGALEERCAAQEAEIARLRDRHAVIVSRMGYIWDTALHNLQVDVHRLLYGSVAAKKPGFGLF